uniref:HTH CENPB-type domain-containing protein n=1 Tax=Latimeria chalumnae TaxID=7897 RepID=H3B5Z4_LATCH
MWFQRASIKGLPLNGLILKAKAESLARDLGKSDFFVTDGWFSCWKVRHNIMYKHTHGELKSADLEGADYWSKTKLQELLSSYNAKDIYNADETWLYCRTTPDGSMVFSKTALSGSKKAVDRRKELTLLLCCSPINLTKVAHHITLLDAIGMAARAWDSLKPATILNCFRKAGFVIGDAAPCTEGDKTPSTEINGENNITDEFLDIDAALPCLAPEDDDTTVVEAVAAKCPREENDRNNDFDDDDAPVVTASTALAGLRDAEHFLIKNRLYDKSSNAFHEVVVSIREIHYVNLV